MVNAQCHVYTYNYMQSITYLSLSSIYSILLLTNKRKNEIDIATYTHIITNTVFMQIKRKI